MSKRDRHDPLHLHKNVYRTVEGIAVERDGVRFPHRPDGVSPQEYRNRIRWEIRRRRRERGG